MSKSVLRVSPTRFGIAFGLIWGLGMFILALIGYGSIFYGQPLIQMINSVYIGYGPTVEGAFIGFFWGFIDFFIFGWLVGIVYNALVGRGRAPDDDVQRHQESSNR